ncbi:MAG: GH3 auxin-responsive promoter family protein [Cytophagaceae bacterium]
MALLGTLLNKGIKISHIIEKDAPSPEQLQKKELKKLLRKAKATSFGKHFSFSAILKLFKKKDQSYYQAYSRIPIYNYNKIFDEWWHRAKAGERDVCWPGLIKYFALSSGTSEAATKHIPLSKAMIRAQKKTSIRQILSLSNYQLPDSLFEKGILMLGGSTHLNKNGHFFEGDLSGIQASRLPFWFQHFYKPGKKISKSRDWNAKLDQITNMAPKWDIGFVVGVPAWIQIMMERIIEAHKLKNIHEIWPNLRVYVHGGVSFEPYKKGFEKLLGKPLTYIETYLASEGFIAFQVQPGKKSMKLVLDNGIFFEFIPFNEENFSTEGDVLPHAKALMVHEVEENVDYGILLSTCAGTWRYLIGDMVRFVSKEACEIIITGRTKHFLSLCGEHLSVENMNKAIQMTSEELNITMKEFTVSGIPYGTLFAHKWYIGTDDKANPEVIRTLLDENLKKLNDDYKVERSAALKDVSVNILPNSVFYKWMKMKGKEGGQNKFPRVMKKIQFDEWEEFVKNEKR